MGSSSGDDYSTPPQQPAPPANLISPMGTSTPYQPNFINFLGNTNTPSTGLTPQMLAQIAATNGPPPGPPPPMGGGMPTQTPAAAGPDPRQRLAEAFLSQNPTMQNSRRAEMEKLAGGPMGPGRGGFQGRGGNSPGEWG